MISKEKGKTLIIQNLQGIGDTLWFVRHYHAIARTTEMGKISLLTRPRSMADQILKADPFIEEVLWLETKPGPHDGPLGVFRLSGLLKSRGFQRVWILHSRSLRYAIAPFLANIPSRVGPGMGLQSLFLNAPPFLEKAEQKFHPIQRATKLLQKHEIFLDEDAAPLPVGEDEKNFAHNFLREFDSPWIGLGIASSEPHKKWPWQHYVKLAQEIFEHQRKGTFFILGGPQESEEALMIQEKLNELKIPAIAVTHVSLSSSLAIIQKLSFIVGNDTGILHAAPMVGSKGLVLLGNSQVPIHHYAEVEGLHLNEDESVREGPNRIDSLSPDRVMRELKELRWIS